MSQGVVDAATLKRMLHDGGEIALLDVREEGVFAKGHMFLAAPVPLSQLEIRVPVLVPRRSTRIVVTDGGEGWPAARRRRWPGTAMATSRCSKAACRPGSTPGTRCTQG